MVPAAHGAWLAGTLRGAEVRTPKGHGHISLVTEYRQEILDWLVG